MSEYTLSPRFIDLNRQQTLIKEQVNSAVARVLEHGHYIMGPEVVQLESDLTSFTGTSNAVTCANGTDALTLVLMAWGVGPGDCVLVPSFTYVASAEAIALLGAVPFFMDVDENSFNVTPKLVEAAISSAHKVGLTPKVVIAVDLFGQPADEELKSVAESHGMRLLVDAAQSFGASIKQKQVGNFGHATTTSFFPAKPLGCYGDGGAVLTNNAEDAQMIRSLRLHGRGDHKYDHTGVGMNSRLDTIQAAILIEKLKIFPEELLSRQRIAEFYSRSLTGTVSIPTIQEGRSSAWAQYTIQVPERKVFQEKMSAVGIPTAVYYPQPLHMQPAYRDYPMCLQGCKVSETLASTVVSLPMHPYLGEDELCLIVDTVKACAEGIC